MSQLRRSAAPASLVSLLAFGGNVFGWTVDEAAVVPAARCLAGRGLQLRRHRRRLFGWVPGHTGGESETIIGKWLNQSGKRNRVVLATKVGKPMGEGKKGLSPAYIREAVEASLQAPADRLHRPLPVARRRCRHAARRIARGLRRPDQGRQGARHRRLELQRAAAGRGARRAGTPGHAALRKPAAAVQPVRPRGVRGRAGAAVPGREEWA